MLIKFGSIVTRGSGKLGGHVYSTNRGGAYVRTNQTPSNPRTPFQQSGRSVFTGLTQGWSGLTEAQRDTWNQATSSFPVTDRFGDSRELSGKGLYISLNKELILTGQVPLEIAPSPGPISVITSLTAGVFSDTGELSLNIQGVPSGETVVLTSSGVVSGGTSFVKNKMRVFIAEFNPVGQDPDATWNLYVARFGTATVGQKIFFGAYTVNASGQRSPMFINSTLVAS